MNLTRIPIGNDNIFFFVNNILVIFGIKFSYSEDDQDSWRGGGGVFLSDFLLSLLLFILGKNKCDDQEGTGPTIDHTECILL